MANPITGKQIVLGITGSIAAYKSAQIASALTRQGAAVDIILTPSAEKFISPLTFQSVTARKAYIDADLWGREGHVVHISLARSASLILVAPASANTIAKLAHGIHRPRGALPGADRARHGCRHVFQSRHPCQCRNA